MVKTKMYKLVSQDYTTHSNTKWEIGKTVIATEPGNAMCTNQVLHCYSNPYLAIIFNPRHANIKNPRLIEIECSEIINTDGLKYTCKEQTMIAELPVPVISTIQKIAFAIKCTMVVYKSDKFIIWANAWLDGTDRTKESAANAANAAATYAAATYAAATYAAAAAAATYAAADAAAANAAYAADAAAANAAYAYQQIGDKFIEIITGVMQSF